jgi:hypothetical protein
MDENSYFVKVLNDRVTFGFKYYPILSEYNQRNDDLIKKELKLSSSDKYTLNTILSKHYSEMRMLSTILEKHSLIDYDVMLTVAVFQNHLLTNTVNIVFKILHVEDKNSEDIWVHCNCHCDSKQYLMNFETDMFDAYTRIYAPYVDTILLPTIERVSIIGAMLDYTFEHFDIIDALMENATINKDNFETEFISAIASFRTKAQLIFSILKTVDNLINDCFKKINNGTDYSEITFDEEETEMKSDGDEIRLVLKYFIKSDDNSEIKYFENTISFYIDREKIIDKTDFLIKMTDFITYEIKWFLHTKKEITKIPIII